MKELMPYDEVKFRLSNIPSLYHKAFLCLTYATLGRVGEIVRHRRNPETNPPLLKKHIQETNEPIIKAIQELRQEISQKIKGAVSLSFSRNLKTAPIPAAVRMIITAILPTLIISSSDIICFGIAKEL